MSELQFPFEPDELRKSVEELYANFGEDDLVLSSRLRSFRLSHRVYFKGACRSVETVRRPDLFGEYGGDPSTIIKPPVASEE